MHAFYARTNEQFAGMPVPDRRFFQPVADRFRERLVFAVASDGIRRAPIGMALLVVKGGNLYGRYWGCAREVEFLHFEACYYRPIEWAIARGIRKFDPGMGGGHKLRRGFRAVANYSLHRFMDPALRRVMKAHRRHQPPGARGDRGVESAPSPAGVKASRREMNSWNWEMSRFQNPTTPVRTDTSVTSRPTMVILSVTGVPSLRSVAMVVRGPTPAP